MMLMGGMPSLALLTASRLSSSDWAHSLLMECANAISENDLHRAHQLIWILNELSSPYGSHEQRLAHYFMQALFSKMSGGGPRTHLSLCAAADRTSTFESVRKTMLKFQEASPWLTFGHAAANGAIMEAMEGESSVHIIDVSSTFCTQWPTLLEALATRAEGAPSVRLTTVVFNEEGAGSCTNRMMEEVGTRLEKFARLMGVPFNFSLMQAEELNILLEQEIMETQMLQAAGGSMQQYGGGSVRTTVPMVAINCVSALHYIPYIHRQGLLSQLQRLQPKIVTLVEDIEAHNGLAGWGRSGGGGGGRGYAERFREALQFYALYFEALEGSMGKVSSERGALERGAARRIMKMLGCEQEEDNDEKDEHCSNGRAWHECLQSAGFQPKPFSDDVVDDVRALLKRYKDGWGLIASPPRDEASPSSHYSLSLTWKDQSVIFASIWRVAI